MLVILKGGGKNRPAVTITSSPAHWGHERSRVQEREACVQLPEKGPGRNVFMTTFIVIPRERNAASGHCNPPAGRASSEAPSCTQALARVFCTDATHCNRPRPAKTIASDLEKSKDKGQFRPASSPGRGPAHKCRTALRGRKPCPRGCGSSCSLLFKICRIAPQTAGKQSPPPPL